MTAYGPVETLARLTANIITIQDRTSEKLNRAVLNCDVNLIRDYYRAGSESLQDTLEAILRTDNVQLLNDFVRSTEEVTDGAIRENGKWKWETPVLKYGLWRNAFRCVLFLKGLGVNLDCVKGDLILRAIEENQLDIIRTLLKETSAEEDHNCARVAAKKGSAEALDMILQCKPQSCSALEEGTGSGLLHLSAGSKGEGSVKCMDLLMDKYGLDLEKKNKKGMTPLHVAAEGEELVLSIR